MIPWQLLASAQVPDANEAMHLYRRGAEFSIRVAGSELMNSRVHGSEDALARLACARIAALPSPRVLIGGLGMGYTLAAALNRLGAESQVVVAELVPAVVAWNQGPLASLAGHPLADPRVAVRECDVAQILKEEQQAYDAILLDVDNGPRGLTRPGNHWLYTQSGLNAAFRALRQAGVFALWSAGPQRSFNSLLNQAGFKVDEKRVQVKTPCGGGFHRIWLADRAA